MVSIIFLTGCLSSLERTFCPCPSTIIQSNQQDFQMDEHNIYVYAWLSLFVYGGYKYMDLSREFEISCKKNWFNMLNMHFWKRNWKHTPVSPQGSYSTCPYHVGLWKLSYKPCSLKHDHDSYNSWDLIHEVIGAIKSCDIFVK